VPTAEGEAQAHELHGAASEIHMRVHGWLMGPSKATTGRREAIEWDGVAH
jgi:hypothetical protein